MKLFKCSNKCCQIEIYPYDIKPELLKKSKRKKRKAGVFVYDPDKDKVLLVQSRGNLWGPPKGTIKYGETERECAIRELEEETNIVIKDDLFSKAYNIHYKAFYFYVELSECGVQFQKHVYDNDVNAVGWIKPKCLQKAIEDGHFIISNHCKILFKQFLGLNVKKSNFIEVRR